VKAQKGQQLGGDVESIISQRYPVFIAISPRVRHNMVSFKAVAALIMARVCDDAADVIRVS
jgi:hypothetical protein